VIDFKASGDKTPHKLLVGDKTPTGGDLFANGTTRRSCS